METWKHYQNKIQKIRTKSQYEQKFVREREREPNPFVNLIVRTSSSLASMLNPQHMSFNPWEKARERKPAIPDLSAASQVRGGDRFTSSHPTILEALCLRWLARLGPHARQITHCRPSRHRPDHLLDPCRVNSDVD